MAKKKKGSSPSRHSARISAKNQAKECSSSAKNTKVILDEVDSASFISPLENEEVSSTASKELREGFFAFESGKTFKALQEEKDKDKLELVKTLSRKARSLSPPSKGSISFSKENHEVEDSSQKHLGSPTKLQASSSPRISSKYENQSGNAHTNNLGSSDLRKEEVEEKILHAGQNNLALDINLGGKEGYAFSNFGSHFAAQTPQKPTAQTQVPKQKFESFCQLQEPGSFDGNFPSLKSSFLAKEKGDHNQNDMAAMSFSKDTSANIPNQPPLPNEEEVRDCTTQPTKMLFKNEDWEENSALENKKSLTTKCPTKYSTKCLEKATKNQV